MPGAGEASRGTTTNSTSSGSGRGAGAGASSSKKKKSGGLFGKVKSAGKGLLGAVGSALGAPQQIMFKAGRGTNDIVQGKFSEGLKSYGGALAEAGTLGQAGGDIDFANANRQWSGDKAKALKLPKGLNTAAGVVIDPLNFATFGAGTAARQATAVAAKTLGKEAAENLAKQGFKKGLTATEKTTVRDALVANAKHAKNPTKTADKQIKALTVRGRGGVGMHVPFTDIGTTLIPGKTVGKVSKATGLSAGKKMVKTSAAGRTWSKAFHPGAAVTERAGLKASNDLQNAISTGSARQANDVADLVTRVKAATGDFTSNAPKGVKYAAEQDTAVYQALEAGDLAAAKAANPELARMIDTADSTRRGIDTSLHDSGALAEGQGREIGTFMHRQFTDEASKAMGRAEKQGLYEGKSMASALSGGSTKTRKYAPDHTAQQIQEAFDAAHRGEAIADPALREAAQSLKKQIPAGTQIYKQSAVGSLIESGADAAKASAAARTLKDVKGITDDIGSPILRDADAVKALREAGEDVPSDWVEYRLGKLGTVHSSPAVKNELTKFMSVIGQDDAVGKFEKYLTQWNRWWKGQVTASLPGGVPFASRNARSNMFLTWADGMNPKYFKTGADFQLKVRKVTKTHAAAIADEGVVPVMKRELGERDFEVWQAAREQGVIGDGFYNIDLSDTPNIKVAGGPKDGGKLKRGVRAVAGSHGTLAVRGRQMNQIVEQHARMSHFLYSIDRLGDLGEAAARTNTVLFDYGRLTPFEQKVVKQILPFYTFMRKNVPGQYRALIENPSRIIGPEKLSQAMSDPLDEDAPEYQKRLGAHKSILPGLAGLITTPERPFQAAVNSFEPLAQLGGALLPGDQGSIEPEGGTPQAIRSLVSMVGGGPAALAKASFEEGTEKSAFTGYNLTDEERRQRLLKAAFPALGRAPTLTGRLPSAIQTKGTKKKARLSTLAQVAAMLGIKLEPSDD